MPTLTGRIHVPHHKDKEDRSAGVRTKGEVKGGETEKTEKEKERD